MPHLRGIRFIKMLHVFLCIDIPVASAVLRLKRFRRHQSHLKAFQNAPLIFVTASVTAQARTVAAPYRPTCSTSSPATFRPVGSKRPMAKVVNMFALYCADDNGLQSSHLHQDTFTLNDYLVATEISTTFTHENVAKFHVD